MVDVKDRPVALVTGAGGGLGGGLVRALAGKGFALVLNDLADGETLSALKAELDASGTPCAVVLQDVAKVEEFDAFAGRVFAAHGRLDCLVNNAGVSVMNRADIMEATPESFDRCIAVNLRAPFFLSQAVARRWLAGPKPEAGARRRSIVTISSVSANDHFVGTAIAEYVISKSALPALVRQFANRLVTEGVDCFEVRPGMMATAMTKAHHARYDKLIAEGYVPARRWGDVNEVGEVVAGLASGLMSFAVGQAICLDGGMMLKVL